MKKGKLSLVAALALTSSLQASTVDTTVDKVKEAASSVKFNGQVKLWYQTMDHEGTYTKNGAVVKDKGLFQRDTDMANE